jgi:hypothetical protein
MASEKMANRNEKAKIIMAYANQWHQRNGSGGVNGGEIWRGGNNENGLGINENNERNKVNIAVSITALMKAYQISEKLARNNGVTGS